MIDYGKPASNQQQMELPGLTDEGAELMQEARKWRSRHHIPEWQYYMRLARKCCEKGGKASPNYCLAALRNEYHVSLPNDFAKCFARIAMEEDSTIRFRVNKSNVDGFTTAKL